MITFSTSLNTGGKAISNTTTAADSDASALKNAINNAMVNNFSSSTTGRGLDIDGIEYDKMPTAQAFLDGKHNILNDPDVQRDSSSNIAAPGIVKKGSFRNGPLSMADASYKYENPNYFGSTVYDMVNKYRGYFEEVFAEGAPTNKVDKDGKIVPDTESNESVRMIGSPSLFNPYYAVDALGITDQTPLLDSVNDLNISANDSRTGSSMPVISQHKAYEDTSDCSIKNLVRLSSLPNSILGQARYKYSDFMYCNDLGKISNNHMITLRRFTYPITDNIFRPASYHDDPRAFNETGGDVGRLITWFGNGDNNLQEIMNYNYSASWKPVDAKIETQNSKDLEKERGLVGSIAILSSKAGKAAITNGLIKPVASKTLPFITLEPTDWLQDPLTQGALYDEHKIYEPLNTIRKTHLYEGNLDFNQEFKLTFKYKLRAYDNINPKSAFLDLLGNILAVTYKSGSFWGGERRTLGFKISQSDWNNAEKLMDGILDSFAEGLAGLIDDGAQVVNIFEGFLAQVVAKTAENPESITSGGFFAGAEQAISDARKLGKRILGKDTPEEDDNENARVAGIADIGNKVKNGVSGVANAAGDIGGKIFNAGKDVGTAVVNNLDKNTILSLLKNRFGRAARYSWQTILTGDPVGLWHVTIGNPLNPIASIGNLIMTDASVQHSGPLGLDDFPTELKVTVSLKHGRPRDSIEIQKMYTKGKSAIYVPLPTSDKYTKISNIYNVNDNDFNVSEQNTLDKINELVTSIKVQASDAPADSREGRMTMWYGDWSPERIKTNRDQLRG